MTDYWIAVSNYFEGGRECASATCRSRQGWWYYWPERDDPAPGDKAIVYQPSTPLTATEHHVQIPRRYWYRFMGDFEVKRLNPNQTKAYTTRRNFLWNNEDFFDLHELYDRLEFVAECIEAYGNYGPCIRSKTWVSINRRDYNLVLSHRTRRNR